MCPNPFIVCNRTYCLVRCAECATTTCCHRWTCTCMSYALHNACKHIHVIQQHEQSHVVTPFIAAVGCESDIQTTLMHDSVPDTDTSDGSGSKDQRRNMLAWIAKLNHGATHLSQSSGWYKDNEDLINKSLNTYNPKLLLPVSKKRTRENVPGFFPKRSKIKSCKSDDPAPNVGLTYLLNIGLEIDISDPKWYNVVSHDVSDTIACISNKFDVRKRTILVKKFMQARALYKCHHCTEYSTALIQSGMILCADCDQMCHSICCKCTLLSK